MTDAQDAATAADIDAIATTAADVLVSASDHGHPDIEFASFRTADDQLLADMYDADGNVVATYPVHITVGERIS